MSKEWCDDAIKEERFTERTERRRAALERGASFQTGPLPPALWAYLQIGNIDLLESHVLNPISWRKRFVSAENQTYEESALDAVRL